MLKKEKSGDPEDIHWDYHIMEDTGKFSMSFYRALISPFIKWFKIKNEGDIKWLLTSNPIRLTIVHTLLEYPLSYDLLYEKVCKKLESHF
ncbi:hypothetical protein KEJ21_06825 [Candidatus Bathyarchaeota archaeon]|nr:hypothetical protein [Candidatus Bathyarchaeota archaeon]MBS7631032.1 hypothetical protein [Candidatus Bathyarchaeota archaeon]